MSPVAEIISDTSLFPALARDAIVSLSPSLIRSLANGAMGRSDVLPFWFGESDQVTPVFIRDAAITSLQSGETFYPQNLGRPYLRAALSKYLTKLHERHVGSECVAVVSAGINGLMLAAQTIMSPGDRVVAVTPLWPNVTEIPKILGASVTRVPLSISDGEWTLDVDRLLAALTPKTRVLILNSPGNPTGWMLKEEQVDIIVDHCRKYGIWILADDVYQRLVHQADLRCAPSFLSRYQDGDRIISVNSFSKAWLMTGFRIGWVVAPPAIIAEFEKLIEYNTCCVFEPSQRAAVAALEQGEDTITALRAHLRMTRNVLVERLRELPGVEVPNAGGGMYAFFRIDGVPDTISFARELLESAGIGLAPGDAFGPEGKGWLRCCHAVSIDKLEEGVSRIERFLTQRRSA
ncbi:pyridoxal phosphate-dependent aminotransferase (plasmid) [Agrobacterium leguminum]|uniref:Aminotransferase n=1 Tax=Agrobacterium deltaense NCPPB 1641 TaxID=1183425 RepID=A0A1S7U986_9HYPH|nr:MULTISPECIES: pyridoxal phosphate-dependent aminotransferase [Agrobacterium]WFS70094.1 pyridoxal phosphate-dependent aminotransferase [Agrobacterium leguminum]CVI63490.1 Aminotransferase class I and II [Agrobacterium deltaense NCPPB 1641]